MPAKKKPLTVREKLDIIRKHNSPEAIAKNFNFRLGRVIWDLAYAAPESLDSRLDAICKELPTEIDELYQLMEPFLVAAVA